MMLQKAFLFHQLVWDFQIFLFYSDLFICWVDCWIFFPYLFIYKNFHFLPSSHTLPLPPLPLLLPLQSQEQSGFPALWEVQVPPPSFQVQEGEHPNRQGSHKARPCSRIKVQRHCPWLLSQPPPSATFRKSNLITCSISPIPTGLGDLPLDLSHHLSGWTRPAGSWLPCSCSPSLCSSFGPWELSPVLQYGSLSLSPSITRWRFYGNMQDIHQCGYRRRPVQAPFPLLLKEQAGDISFDTWEPLNSQVSF